MKRKVYLLTTYFWIFTVLFALAVQNAAAQDKKELERAKALANQADEFYRQKNYQEAINRYSQAIAVAPNYPYAHFSKGYAHYNLDQIDPAIQEMDIALKQGYPAIEVYKVRWYLHYQKRNFDAALSDVMQAQRIEPQNAYFYLASGDIHRQRNSARDALNSYLKAAELDQKNADVHYFIALSYASLGEFIQQGLSAIKAIQNKTRYTGESYILIGDSLQRAKKFEEAAESYERALIAKPDAQQIYSTLSDIYRSLNRFEEAIATAKRGLRLYPKDGNFYISLSWYYSLADRHQEAVVAALEGIKMLPKEHMGYTNLCRAYNDTKLYASAVQACNNALKISPNDGETFFYLARAYDLQKKPDEATPLYKRAVDGLLQFTRNNPEYSDGFYLLGNAYYAVGNRTNAISAYKRSLELSPRFAKARYNLGYMYLLDGDKTAARVQYNELRAIDAVLADRLLQAIQTN